jgi:hypothetical protein
VAPLVPATQTLMPGRPDMTLKYSAALQGLHLDHFRHEMFKQVLDAVPEGRGR